MVSRKGAKLAKKKEERRKKKVMNVYISGMFASSNLYLPAFCSFSLPLRLGAFA
jgi:hypothetical protein